MKILFSLLLLTTSTLLFSQTDSPAKKDTIVATRLQQVILSSTKNATEVYPDRTVINVDAQINAAGDNALQLLRRSPGVVVDATDNIKMNGKSGVTVLIDGKNIQLSGQDLAELLKSIEAGNIQQLEIITNPSAKYDAAGNAGIINIKLKKSLSNGFNGNIAGSVAQSTHARQNGTLNLNYRRGKAALFMNAGGNNGLQHTVANNDRLSGNQTFTQRSVEKDQFDGYSLRTGADFFITKKLVVGALWMRNYKNTFMDNGSTTLLALLSRPDTLIETRSIAPFKNKRNAFNVNVNYNSAKVQYTLDADYTRFNSSVNNSLVNESIDDQKRLINRNEIENNQQVAIEIASLKGDWTLQLPKQYQLETGFKLMKTTTNNALVVKNQAGMQWIADTGRTNYFKYREGIGSLYASLKNGGKKFSWQIGLRAEHSTVKGTSADLNNQVSNRPDTAYLNLFPTLYLQYKLTENYQVGLTANRRIDRPNYQDQNPFIYSLDALNSEQGNPYLIPQLTNSVELYYTYKYATSFKINYSKTNGYIEQLTYQNGKYTIMIPQNAGSRQMLTFSVSSPLKITKWWSSYISMSPFYHHYNVVLSGFGTSRNQQAGSWGFNGYIGNTLQLGKGYKGEVSSWYNFQNQATIYTSKPIGSLNVGVQKNLLKDKATLKLTINDLLNTQRWQQEAVNENLVLTTYRKWESRNVTIGFTWRMGNTKIKNARERQTVGEEDAGRIK